MSLALASCIALLVTALNLTTESAILRHAQKDWPTLSGKVKRIGIILLISAVVFFSVGFYYKYMNSNPYLSLAVTLVILGGSMVLKAIRLKENKPEKLGRQLRYGAIVMAIIAVGLLVWTLVRLYTG